MPFHIQTMSRALRNNMTNILNTGLIFLTFFETYLFPFSIIKWFIVITKYRSVITRLSAIEASNEVVKPQHTHKLMLVTTEKCMLSRDKSVERISHVYMLIETEGIQVRSPLVLHSRIPLRRCSSSRCY